MDEHEIVVSNLYVFHVVGIVSYIAHVNVFFHYVVQVCLEFQQNQCSFHSIPEETVCPPYF